MLFKLKGFACLSLFMLTTADAQQSDQQPATTQPSKQLLEFLADFGAVDQQTYELIEYHALQDSHNEKEKEQEKSNEN